MKNKYIKLFENFNDENDIESLINDIKEIEYELSISSIYRNDANDIFTLERDSNDIIKSLRNKGWIKTKIKRIFNSVIKDGINIADLYMEDAVVDMVLYLLSNKRIKLGGDFYDGNYENSFGGQMLLIYGNKWWESFYGEEYIISHFESVNDFKRDITSDFLEYYFDTDVNKGNPTLPGDIRINSLSYINDWENEDIDIHEVINKLHRMIPVSGTQFNITSLSSFYIILKNNNILKDVSLTDFFEEFEQDMVNLGIKTELNIDDNYLNLSF